MLKNAYLFVKIGADTAENEQHFAEILPTDALWRLRPGDDGDAEAPRVLGFRPGEEAGRQSSGRLSGRVAELRALKRGHLVACSVWRSWDRSLDAAWRLWKAPECSVKVTAFWQNPEKIGQNFAQVQQKWKIRSGKIYELLGKMIRKKSQKNYNKLR